MESVVKDEMSRLEENLSGAGEGMQEFIKSYINERVEILRADILDRIDEHHKEAEQSLSKQLGTLIISRLESAQKPERKKRAKRPS